MLVDTPSFFPQPSSPKSLPGRVDADIVKTPRVALCTNIILIIIAAVEAITVHLAFLVKGALLLLLSGLFGTIIPACAPYSLAGARYAPATTCAICRGMCQWAHYTLNAFVKKITFVQVDVST